MSCCWVIPTATNTDARAFYLVLNSPRQPRPRFRGPPRPRRPQGKRPAEASMWPSVAKGVSRINTMSPSATSRCGPQKRRRQSAGQIAPIHKRRQTDNASRLLGVRMEHGPGAAAERRRKRERLRPRYAGTGIRKSAVLLRPTARTNSLAGYAFMRTTRVAAPYLVCMNAHRP